jgi:hypothetical protein
MRGLKGFEKNAAFMIWHDVYFNAGRINLEDNFVHIRLRDTKINGYLFEEVLNFCTIYPVYEKLGLSVKDIFYMSYPEFDIVRSKIKEVSNIKANIDMDKIKDLEKQLKDMKK